ncbi:MAG: aminopeptidase [Elusimicrobia bacterium]|nr:aminopeptidase [Elusimicrobiota bacterium]
MTLVIKVVAVVVCSAFLASCSPLYVLKSASGEARLLWHRRDIAAASVDPKTSEPWREKLLLVLAARQFAFSSMGLRPSRDYSTYSPVEGPVTFVVSGCAKTRFAPYLWWFPVVGKVPYKGYFKKADALREMNRLQDKGWDARVGGAAAYNTPLWFSDPLPSAVLEYDPGSLAELLIHELAHQTVWFKGRVEFNEAMAGFIGRQGALEFLERRFGAQSQELAYYRAELRRRAELASAIDELYSRLDELYRGDLPRAGKLARREDIFAWGRARLEAIADPPAEPLNNATVLANRLYYRDQASFQDFYERHGRDWRRTIAALKRLERKDPFAALSSR